MRLLIVAGLAMALALGVPDPPSASADGGAVAAAKERKKKRRPYPPARLWYRIELSFEGSQSNDGCIVDCPSSFTRTSTWTLRSNTAVRVTLLCVNPRFPDEPFFDRLKRRGKKRSRAGRRIGGCLRRRSARLQPTLRFRANASGEITSWRHIDTQPIQDCTARITTLTLRAAQPLRGVLAARSLTSAGLMFSSRARPVGATAVDSTQSPITCSGPAGPYVVPGNQHQSQFEPVHHIGFESVVDARPLTDAMNFTIRPRQFGRTMQFSFAAGQAYDPNRPQLGGDGHHHYEKRHSYRLTLRPCPGRGRNVGAC